MPGELKGSPPTRGARIYVDLNAPGAVRQGLVYAAVITKGGLSGTVEDGIASFTAPREKRFYDQAIAELTRLGVPFGSNRAALIARRQTGFASPAPERNA